MRSAISEHHFRRMADMACFKRDCMCVVLFPFPFGTYKEATGNMVWRGVFLPN